MATTSAPKWTHSEMEAIRNWKGKLAKFKLEGRTPGAIRTRRLKMGCDDVKTKLPWKFEEDTILRYTPARPHAHKYFQEMLPWRKIDSSSHRYRNYIAPLLGKSDKVPGAVGVESHMRLARSDEELDNLHRYYFGTPEGGTDEEEGN